MTNNKKELVAYLMQFVSENKHVAIERVIEQRTRYVTVALEDIYKIDNVSAAVRSIECFGLQDVHIIEQTNSYSTNIGITKGAADWIDCKRYRKPDSNNTEECFKQLRADNYMIVATSPKAGGYTIQELPLDRKVALIFGSEIAGLSSYALEHADAFVTIPMYGFTQSFNISVSVALCAYELTKRLRQSDSAWQLSEQEMYDIKLAWLRRVVRGADELEKLFLSRVTD